MRNSHEYQYLNLLSVVTDVGCVKGDRTGTGTTSIFDYTMDFDLSLGFPLLTTKRVHWKSVVGELLWMLSGSSNNNDLRARGVTIWDEWADPDTGSLGPVYGQQWRSWKSYDKGPIDQISKVQRTLREKPDARRHLVSAWNVADLDDMALEPCHVMFQFYSEPRNGERFLHCKLTQRSADVFLGLPFNIASYALLTMMMAQTTGHRPGRFVHSLGDTHIYSNHVEQVAEQFTREPYPAPTVKLNPKVTDILDFTADDITLENYQHHPAIKAPVAV